MSDRFQIVTEDPYSGRRIRHDIPADDYAEAERAAIARHGRKTGVPSVDIAAENIGVLDSAGHQTDGS